MRGCRKQDDQGRFEGDKPFLKSGVAPDAPGSKQAASLLALAGLMKPEEADRRYLAVNGGHGFSTFYGYYMLRAMLLPAIIKGRST